MVVYVQTSSRRKSRVSYSLLLDAKHNVTKVGCFATMARNGMVWSRIVLGMLEGARLRGPETPFPHRGRLPPTLACQGDAQDTLMDIIICHNMGGVWECMENARIVTNPPTYVIWIDRSDHLKTRFSGRSILLIPSCPKTDIFSKNL